MSYILTDVEALILGGKPDEALQFALAQDAVDCFTIGAESREEMEDLLRKIPPASVRGPGTSPRNANASTIPYTGSNAATTLAVCALTAASAPMNSVCASAVQPSPSNTSSAPESASPQGSMAFGNARSLTSSACGARRNGNTPVGNRAPLPEIRTA